MRNNPNKMYNIIFPIWLLVLFPPILLISLIGNFVIDYIVLRFGMRKWEIKCTGRRPILPVYLFGFLADILGMLAMLVGTGVINMLNSDVANTISQAVYWNPFSSFIGFVYVTICMAFSGFLIYLFNKHFSFRKLDTTNEQKHKLSLLLAIVTAPWLFLFPTCLVYLGF